MPSVDSSLKFLLLLVIVFTALINFASSEISPSIFAARFLRGSVTFRPLDDLSEKNSEIKLSKLPSSTL